MLGDEERLDVLAELHQLYGDLGAVTDEQVERLDYPKCDVVVHARQRFPRLHRGECVLYVLELQCSGGELVNDLPDAQDFLLERGVFRILGGTEYRAIDDREFAGEIFDDISRVVVHSHHY